MSVGCLSEARFLLMYTSLLTSDHQPSSLSALANSGLIALLQTLLHLAGPDQADSEAVPEEEMQVVLTSQKRKNTSTLAEMAAAIKPKTKRAMSHQKADPTHTLATRFADFVIRFRFLMIGSCPIAPVKV